MAYHFILIPLALGFLLPSLIIPWAVINFLGQYSYSPLDIITAIISSQPQNKFHLLNLIATYNDSYFAIIFSMVTYITSIATMIVSAISKMYKSKIGLIAGALSITSGVLWIYSIESFKIHFIQNAVESGGIIGEEFKGRENIIINSIVIMGFGHYLALISGVIAILAYLWRNSF